MTTARDVVLARVHQALRSAPAPGPVPRHYPGATGDVGSVELLVERLEDYKATVVRGTIETVGDCVRDRLVARRSHSLVLPNGSGRWLTAGLERSVAILRDTPRLSPNQLDGAVSVITGCTLAIAETGTLILTHGAGQGRRALTLLPDHHIVVVCASQIVPGLADAVAALDPTQPMTWISGPSATSDIELSRVEGVHGPRNLDVVLIEDV